MYHDQVGFIPVIQEWFQHMESICTIYHRTKRGEKNTIISIAAEEPSDKIQPIFMIKTLKKLGIVGKLPQHKKSSL